MLTIGDNKLTIGDNNDMSLKVAEGGTHAERLREVTWIHLVEEWDM